MVVRGTKEWTQTQRAEHAVHLVKLTDDLSLDRGGHCRATPRAAELPWMTSASKTPSTAALSPLQGVAARLRRALRMAMRTWIRANLRANMPSCSTVPRVSRASPCRTGNALRGLRAWRVVDSQSPSHLQPTLLSPNPRIPCSTRPNRTVLYRPRSPTTSPKRWLPASLAGLRKTRRGTAANPSGATN